MADIFSKAERSRVMGSIRSRGNKNTELRLAKILRRAGVRGWRRHSSVPGRPDFVIRQLRLAIFVDGCFWHGCRRHGRKPEDNREYWLPKLARTIARDKATTSRLRRDGWTVLRLWEHELYAEEHVLQRCSIAMKRATAKKKFGAGITPPVSKPSATKYRRARSKGPPKVVKLP